MSNIFKTKLNAACIVLIPACIGINYLGKLFASVLKLPLWLDSIGTCIGAVLGGPIIGGICGAANNLIYGFTTGDSITLVYALTSLGIGVAVGIMARLGRMKKLSGAVLTACVAGFVAVLISTHPVLGRYYRQPLGRRGIRMVSGFRPSGSAGLLPGRGDRRCPG